MFRRYCRNHEARSWTPRDAEPRDALGSKRENMQGATGARRQSYNLERVGPAARAIIATHDDDTCSATRYGKPLCTGPFAQATGWVDSGAFGGSSPTIRKKPRRQTNKSEFITAHPDSGLHQDKASRGPRRTVYQPMRNLNNHHWGSRI